MGDLIVVAGALFGVLIVITGIGWFVPSVRRRLAGQRTGTAAGPLPGVGFIVAGLVVVAVSMGVVEDGGASDSGDVAATCDLLDGGEDEISVESLDRLIAVAPDGVAASVRTVRDRLAAVGESAFDEPAVGVAFEEVGAFEAEECGD